MFNTASPGGAFAGPATAMNYNHNHASQMAHSAASRLAIAHALGGAGGPAAVPAVPSVAPVAPVAPVGAVQPGNYKVALASHLAQRGVPVSVGHIHSAIDGLTQAGHFTPGQGAALKQHNGPLQGPQGQQAMGMIANAVLAGRRQGTP